MKFKVGDRVKIVQTPYVGPELDVGRVGRIICFDGAVPDRPVRIALEPVPGIRAVPFYYCNDEGWSFEESELELVKEAAEAVELSGSDADWEALIREVQSLSGICASAIAMNVDVLDVRLLTGVAEAARKVGLVK